MFQNSETELINESKNWNYKIAMYSILESGFTIVDILLFTRRGFCYGPYVLWGIFIHPASISVQFFDLLHQIPKYTTEM